MVLMPVSNEDPVEITLESFNQLVNKDEFLKHAEDMQRLQKSIIGELGKLEQQRSSLKGDVESLRIEQTNAGAHLQAMENKLVQLKADVKNMIETQAETFKDYPAIARPLQPLSNIKETTIVGSLKEKCSLDTCFDYSRCSVISGFPIYLYPTTSGDNILLSMKTTMMDSIHISMDPGKACMYMYLSDGSNTSWKSLPYWGGDGRNHMIINPSSRALSVDRGRAMVAQPYFESGQTSPNFDVVLPYMNREIIEVKDLPTILPVRRRYMASFRGNAPKTGEGEDNSFVMALAGLNSKGLAVEITVQCVVANSCSKSQWCHCHDHETNNVENNSTFLIIPNVDKIRLDEFSYRLNVALLRGSIPVVLGNFHTLPLADAIPWQKAIISLPIQRVTELTFILRNVLEPDIVLYKKKGRLILEHHLLSMTKMVSTFISLLRTRINIPPPPVPAPKSNLIYNERNPMLTFDARLDHSNELLGPLEDAFPSLEFQRNFTSCLHKNGDAHITMDSNLYPNTPWDPILPTDAKYHGR